MLLSYLFPAFYRSPNFNQWLQDVQQDTFFPHPEIAACDGIRTHGGSVFGSVPYDIGSDKNEVQIDKKIGGIPTAFQWIEILLRPQNANICTLGT